MRKWPCLWLLAEPRWVAGSAEGNGSRSDTGRPTVPCTCSGRAKGREAPGPGAVPPATHLHGVRQVELLGRAAELLPGLELRHRGFGQRETTPWSQERRCRPGGPTALSCNRPQRRTLAAPRWRRTSARAIGQPRPRRSNGQEACCQGAGPPRREVGRGGESGCRSAACRAGGLLPGCCFSRFD